MLLIVDNYDSFVFNVVRYCEELGHPATVVRNDALSLAQIEEMRPRAIVISPGPADPAQAGISLEIVTRLSGRVPILGVCLGHQCIGAAFGGRIARSREPMHGRTSRIAHAGDGLFRALPNPLTVGRYHSLVVETTPALEATVAITAVAESGEVMALAHRTHPTYGVQFHPESVLSECGHEIFANFFAIAEAGRIDAVA